MLSTLKIGKQKLKKETVMNTIIENNKIIAEFMGWDINSPSTFPIQLHQEAETQGNWKLLFHSDWNWLMEVAERIEGLSKEGETFSFSITKISVRVLFKGNRIIDLPIDESKIEAVYNACIEFIKWYNEQKEV